jgi:prenyltransferase beta subunit
VATARAIERLRALQFSSGYWLGEWRGFMLDYYYGAALVQCGRDPASEVLQDVCDQIESYQQADGGFAHCGEADSQPLTTRFAQLLLQRCRPGSRALSGARRFLARSPRFPDMPWTLLNEWVLEPQSRARILTVQPPPRLLRHFAWKFAPRLMSEVPDESNISPHVPGWFKRQAGWRALQALCWPLPEDLERAAHDAMPPAFGLTAYPAFLALQLLAGDRPFCQGRERTARFVVPYVDRYLYADRSIYYVFYAMYFLVVLEALGRTEDAAGVRAALEGIRYRKGGWLGTTMAGCNVFDTGLALQALLDCGVAGSDPAIQRGCEFLHRARMPSGIWSWSWEDSAGPRGHRCADSDDSGIALLALERSGSPHARARLAEVVASLLRFQRPSGGIATMDWGDSPLNPYTPSNTSRSIQALVRLGMQREHPSIQRALAWLTEQQRPDGTWFDYWLTGPLYGTALALDALVGLGYRERGHPDVERALHYVLRMQNSDGGWGFDWYGRRTTASVVEHTAWGLYILCSFARREGPPISAIQAAVRFLVDRQRADGDWDATYVGNYNGIEGYASTTLPIVFTLRALAAYEKLMQEHLPKRPGFVRFLRVAERRASAAPGAEELTEAPRV